MEKYPYLRLPIALVAITNVRIARGQSVADVTDIQVMRDNLGYVYIPGTSLKGSMKAHLYKRICERLKDESGSEQSDSREIASLLINLLFGTVGIGDNEENKIIKETLDLHRGLVVVKDAKLVFVPVTSEEGLIFLTTPFLLERLALSVGSDTKAIDGLAKLPSDSILLINLKNQTESNDDSRISIAGGITLNVIVNDSLEGLKNFLVDILTKTFGDYYKEIFDDVRIGIVQDDTYQVILNKAIIIRPGIKIKGFVNDNDDVLFYDKSVSEEGPRFEEEIPKFSVFITELMVLNNKLKFPISRLSGEKGDKLNRYMKGVLKLTKNIKVFTEDGKFVVVLEALDDTILKLSRNIIVGGKETLLRGLVEIVPIEKKLDLGNISMSGYSPLNIHKIRMKDIENVLNFVLTEKFDSNIEELLSSLEKEHGKLKGKFSSLPERFRMLGPITALMFYRLLKEDASGEGYREVVKVAKLVLREYKNSTLGISLDENILDLSGRIRKENVKDYLETAEYLIDLFTRLKYIIRSYQK